MTLLELVVELWRESGTGGPQPTTVVGQVGEANRLVQWVRQADLEIQQVHSDWNFLWGQDSITTVADTSTYADPVPEGVSSYDEDSFVLDGTTPIEAVRYTEVKNEIRPTGTSQPTQVVILPNGTLRCDPTPNAAYTIAFDYWAKPQAMNNDNDESLIPAEFRQVIVGKALMHYAEYENAPEIMQKAQRMYTDWFGTLMSKNLPGQRDAHTQAENNEIVVTVE